MANPNITEAQKRASSPEARAKAVATMKRRRAEKEAREAGLGGALLKHAKLTGEKKPKKIGRPKKMKGKLHGGAPKGIPLDLIPDGPKKRTKAKPGKAMSATRQEVVLALLKYLNGE